MSVPDRLCAATANAQFGVISRQQAHAAGLSDKGILHRVATGRWQRVLPHVYRIVGAPESWHQKLMAAVLWAGEGSAISHRSAAAMWGLDGARRERIEVSAIHKLTRPGSWPIPHRPARLPLDEVTTISGIAVTTVARTLLDLGAVVLLPAVERALDGALRDGLVHVKELRTFSIDTAPAVETERRRFVRSWSSGTRITFHPRATLSATTDAFSRMGAFRTRFVSIRCRTVPRFTGLISRIPRPTSPSRSIVTSITPEDRTGRRTRSGATSW
jgi:hypothetical protein